MSEKVWILKDPYYIEGVYASLEQFTELTGRKVSEKRGSDARRIVSVEAPQGDVLAECILVEWEVGKHELDYVYPDGSRSLRHKP